MSQRTSIALLLTTLALSSCGRYLPPISPELLAPRAVEGLTVTPIGDGIGFSWTSSQQDQRGKDLRSSNGYRIRRKELTERGDETNDAVLFKEVGYVPDQHIQVRDRLRAEARAQGRITRKVNAPEEMMKFSFVDTTAQRNKSYLYKIVPENQGQVEGSCDVMVKVVFKGQESDVTLLKPKEVSDLPVDSALQPKVSTPSA